MLKKKSFTYIQSAKNALALMAFVLAAFSITSCNNDDVEIKPSHLRYYGLEEGMWREYAVDSVVYRGSTLYANDTLNFMIREEIDSSFTDNTGAKNYFIKTYSKDKAADEWRLRYISAATVNEQKAELLYNNDRYVKLIFPAINGQGWNANLYNDEDMENFRKSTYSATHQSANINGKNFDSTVIVQVQNHDDVVFHEYETEQYAAGVGLVKYVWEELETQPDPDDKTKLVKRGWILNKTLTAYGKE
ncbi:MAG: hypothetical protein ACXWDO_01055 [Bacteroidia bacterium]